MEQGSLRLPDMDRSLCQVPLRLCQRHQVTARFGTPLRRLERLCTLDRLRGYCASRIARQLRAVLSIKGSHASRAYASSEV